MSSRVKVAYFDSKMKSQAQVMHKLENAIRVSLTKQAAEIHQALHSNEFYIVFQPIINIKEGYPSAFEALLRWQHPEQGNISPAVFIPAAEQIGVMEVLGLWVLRRACKAAVKWPSHHAHRAPKISVNVSPAQLRNRALIVESVRSALKESGLPAERLKLEITESQEISNEMIETIHSLKALGCSIAMDDFGTGYSSLMELNLLPIDFVKLDRSFIKEIGSQDEENEKLSLNMVRAVVALVDVFKLTPIVEGVETLYQLNTCSDVGINLIQGFYYSKPMKEDAVHTYLLDEFGE
jgi:EAL domain-containing protein (putative c-di-GMP-specific phosphodiesterase class I)